MDIWIFGNTDLPQDALPLQLLPELQKEFPHDRFVVRDPNEEWVLPNQLIIIDTVVGLKHVRVFHDLTSFKASPRVTMHDFDAFTNLLWLEKMHKLPPLTIIGVPAKNNGTINSELVAALRQLAT